MQFIQKLIKTFVYQCEKGRGVDNWTCLVFARVIFAFFFSLNVISIFTFFLGKKWSLRYLYFEKYGNGGIYLLILPITIFILLQLIFPRKTIDNIELSTIERKKFLVYIFAYTALTIALITLSNYSN